MPHDPSRARSHRTPARHLRPAARRSACCSAARRSASACPSPSCSWSSACWPARRGSAASTSTTTSSPSGSARWRWRSSCSTADSTRRSTRCGGRRAGRRAGDGRCRRHRHPGGRRARTPRPRLAGGAAARRGGLLHRCGGGVRGAAGQRAPAQAAGRRHARGRVRHQRPGGGHPHHRAHPEPADARAPRPAGGFRSRSWCSWWWARRGRARRRVRRTVPALPARTSRAAGSTR